MLRLSLDGYPALLTLSAEDEDEDECTKVFIQSKVLYKVVYKSI